MVMPDPKVLFWIAVFVADATTVNLNGIKRLLANGFSTFSRNGPKGLHKNPSDCPILDSWLFENFILADEVFAKPLRNLEISKLVY